MKLKRQTISFILIFALLSGLLPLPVYGEDIAATGTAAGDALIRNAGYIDIGGNPNADNIMKMTVYSIVREYGNNTYRPSQAASKRDMLAALVRAIGRQDEAVRLGERLLAADPSLGSVDAYLMGHIEAAKAAGIVTAQEAAASGALTAAELAGINTQVAAAVKANWKMTMAQKNQLAKQLSDKRSFQKAYGTAVTREEAALWIARALSLTPATGDATMKVYGYSDWKAIKTENLPYIESVLGNGIMNTKAATFSPKGNIGRGEMAAIMNLVANKSIDKLGYKTGYGRVTAVSMARDFGAVSDTFTTGITIETPSADMININVQKRSTTSSISQEAVPVIKNGRIGSEGLIAEGDIVEYTLDKDNKAILLQVAGLNEIDGTFAAYDPQTNTVQVGDKNNNIYFLKVMPDSAIMVQQQPVDIGRLEPNSPAKAVFANDILKSLSVDTAPELVSGREIPVRIVFANTMGNMIQVADEYNNKQNYELAETAAIYINGGLQDISAIGFDQDAVIRLFNGKVHEVKIYTDTFDDETNRLLTLTASVRDISGSGITLLTDDKPKTPDIYTFDRNTPVIKDRQNVSSSVLRQGDRVKIEVNSTNNKHILRMEIQGNGVQIQGVYKGDIREVVPETGEIVLSNVYSYGYYDWVKKDGYIKYKLDDSAEIYNKDTKISTQRLKDYIGKTIYAVSRKNFGTEEIIKGLLKDGYEDTISKNIYDVKWTTKQLTMSDDRVLNFSDGSIIIRDGRLLDPLYLSKQTGAHIIQNRSALGEGSAQLISLESFNGFGNYNITKGYLHTMGDDYYTVENSYKLEDNEWVESGEPTFLLSDETYVYDSVIEKGPITVDKFLESRYKPYTYTWPNYKSDPGDNDYHVDDQYHYDYYKFKGKGGFHEHFLMYAITDNEGSTHAINLIKKNKESFKEDKTFTERFIAGQLKTIDKGNRAITVINARDYSPVYNQWRPIKAAVPLGMEKVVILKDGRAIEMDGLAEGDNVYIMSDNDYAMFILVE